MENFETAVSFFSENIDLDDNQRYDLLESNIQNGYVNEDVLKKEMLEAISNPSFDWRDFANKTNLLYGGEHYTTTEITEYVKFWLFERLFPETVLDLNLLRTLGDEVVKIVCNSGVQSGPVSSCKVFEEIKKSEIFYQVHYFHLMKLDYLSLNLEVEKNWDKPWGEFFLKCIETR
jgi:hypothetical protein